MDLLASTAQQGAIDCVLHQRVLEGVLCIGWGAPLEDQFGAYELRQGPVHLVLRHSRDGADQLMRERPSEGRTDLRHLAHGCQAIEPCQERGLERGRDGKPKHGPSRIKAVARVGQHAALDHRLGQFLDEQRYAIGPIDDMFGDLLGQRLASGHPQDHLGALSRGQTTEADLCHVRAPDPGRRELWPEGDDQQGPEGGHPVDDEVQQVERGGVDPVHILEHHQYGPTRRQSLELGQEGPKRILLALLWREAERWIAIADRHGQQVRDQRDGLAEVNVCLRKQCLELVQPLLVRIVTPESRCPLELRDGREKRAVLVVRRAETAQADVWIIAQPLQYGLGEARFANAGLTRYQHDRAVAAFYLLPAAHQQLDLLIAAEQWRSGYTQGLEAAIDRARTDDSPDRHRVAEACDGHAPESEILEESTDVAAGAAVDNHRIRLGQRLKPRGQIGGLTDHLMFLRRALPDEITDDHQTSGNPNSHSQSCLRAGIESCHGRDQCQPGAYRALSVVFIRPRITEICEHAVAHVPGNKPPRFLDLLGTAAVVRANDFPQVLRVEPCRERCRANKISEHHRELTSLGLGPRRRRGSRSGLVELRNRTQYLPAMAERNTDFFEVMVGQIAQNAWINVVLGKGLRVLPQAKCVEPVRNLLHGGPPLSRCGLSEPWRLRKLYPFLLWMARTVVGTSVGPSIQPSWFNLTNGHREAATRHSIAAAGAGSPRGAPVIQFESKACGRSSKMTPG